MVVPTMQQRGAPEKPSSAVASSGKNSTSSRSDANGHQVTQSLFRYCTRRHQATSQPPAARAPTDASSTAPIAWHLGFHLSRECVPCGRAPQFLIPGREGELAAYHVRDFLASDLEDLANVAAPRRVAMSKAYGTRA